MEGGEEGDYISIAILSPPDSYIKMGSDESHFNVSLIVRDKSQNSVHRPQLSKREESRSGIEPRYFCVAA